MQLIIIEQDPGKPLVIQASNIRTLKYSQDEQLVEILNNDDSVKYLNCWNTMRFDALIIMLAKGVSVCVADDCWPQPLLKG